MRHLITVFCFFAALFAANAHADEAQAESCLKNKIWEGYDQGFAVRSMMSASLGHGENKVYLVTLYSGNEYQFLACADGDTTNVDLVLYDALGNKIAADTTTDREPRLTHSPTATDTFYLAVHISGVLKAGVKVGVASAVTYK